MGKLTDPITEGTRVTAPNPRRDGETMEGVVQDNLSVMYFVKFDNGDSEFVYKAEPVRPI